MKKYFSIFTTQLLNSLAYPAEMFWRSLAIVVFMWIFASLWKVTYAVTDVESSIGLSLNGMLWYFMLGEVIELSKPRLTNIISEAVKDGSIAYLLNKPFNFLLYHYSAGMGESIVRALMHTIFGTAVVWLIAGPPPPLIGWLMAIPALLLAWSVHFCFNAMIGLLAFITEEVTPFEWIYQKFVQVMGGLFIPLDLFPLWLRTIASALPFAAIIYGPARLFVDPDPNRFFALMATQTAWLLALSLLLGFIYQRSMQRLAINGG